MPNACAAVVTAISDKTPAPRCAHVNSNVDAEWICWSLDVVTHAPELIVFDASIPPSRILTGQGKLDPSILRASRRRVVRSDRVRFAKTLRRKQVRIDAL